MSDGLSTVERGDVVQHESHGVITVIGAEKVLIHIATDGPTYEHRVRFLKGDKDVEIYSATEVIREPVEQFFENVSEVSQ